MNRLGSILGMVGLYKFFLNRSLIKVISTVQKVFTTVLLDENNSIRLADRQKLVMDMATALWEGRVNLNW